MDVAQRSIPVEYNDQIAPPKGLVQRLEADLLVSEQRLHDALAEVMATNNELRTARTCAA